MPPVAHNSPSDVSRDRQKKPRHRHSPAQLAALNELFDQDEHPALELRVSLAERLGMETKTVNAWFQNKRASSKKRTVSRAVLDSDSPSTNLSAVGQTQEDYDDDMHSGMDYPLRSSLQHSALGWPQYNTSSPEDNDGRPLRIRPTSEQADELKRFFQVVQHPSAEQRQTLADRIGMPYHSVTNWFQNQRSIAKRRKDDESLRQTDSGFGDRNFANFPPPSHYHPSLGLPPPTRPSQQSQSSILAHIKRSTSPVYSHQEENTFRRSNPRRSASVTPYSTPSMSRPRRSRPEPHQLAALNYLYSKNSHPSVEERTALSQEVGMDLGKVTNWFRNMRQQHRRHAKKAGSGDEDEYFPTGSFNGVSRSGSPSAHSSSSSMNDDEMQGGGSGSDDDDDEAVTPRSESPAIAATKSTYPPPSLPRLSLKTLSLAAIEPTLVGTESTFKSGIKIEDALLLLTFHRQEVLI